MTRSGGRYLRTQLISNIVIRRLLNIQLLHCVDHAQRLYPRGQEALNTWMQALINQTQQNPVETPQAVGPVIKLRPAANRSSSSTGTTPPPRYAQYAIAHSKK